MADDNNKDTNTTGAKADIKSNVNALELWLDGINKQLPQIPKKGQDVLAQLAPWLALAGGVFSLLATWGFWQAGHLVNRTAEWANDISRMYGSGEAVSSPTLGFTWYLALVLLLVQAVILLVAFPKLRDGKKSGWDLLFYGSLLSIIIGLAYVFTPGYGVSSLFGYVIGTAISLYLLFQVRAHFTK